MSKIFCLMGKSATGKDTIYKKLCDLEKDRLQTIVTYTTRPIRAGETEGAEYHFTNEEGFEAFKASGKIIEDRAYNTVHGIWRYFTADDGQIKDDGDYIIIGTLEMFDGLRNYYGDERIVPLYIDVDDGIRLERALNREKKQETPKYKELCRRFLADCEDFSDEKLSKSGVNKSFINDDIDTCISEIREYITNNL